MRQAREQGPTLFLFVSERCERCPAVKAHAADWEGELQFRTVYLDVLREEQAAVDLEIAHLPAGVVFDDEESLVVQPLTPALLAQLVRDTFTPRLELDADF